MTGYLSILKVCFQIAWRRYKEPLIYALFIFCVYMVIYNWGKADYRPDVGDYEQAIKDYKQ
uniref:Uncharacterized protein n=1 Tax=viral metagenome TaxID=1070528 RepID=A0A6M3LJG5_9ZZZZ